MKRKIKLCVRVRACMCAHFAGVSYMVGGGMGTDTRGYFS